MFEVRRLNTMSGFMTVVTATGYENPLSSLSDVASVLRANCDIGNESVLFDLLCSNGEEWNRFVVVDYNGSSFLRDSVSVVQKCDVSCDLLESQARFFEDHPEYIQDSVLV